MGVYRDRHPALVKYRMKRHNAKTEGAVFALSLTCFERLYQVRVCACCGCELRIERGCRDPDIWTLDRKDPTQGYTEENTYVLCYGCNRKKNNITLADIEKISAYMRDRRAPLDYLVSTGR